MSDKRILSLVAFGLFLAAFLLPWPIAAIGRDEPAMIFAGISMFLAVTFAMMSRRESFSRIVLIPVAGVLVLFTVVALVSVPIYFWQSSTEVEIEKVRSMPQTDVVEGISSLAKQDETAVEAQPTPTAMPLPDDAVDRSTEPSGLIASDDPTEEWPARRTNISFELSGSDLVGSEIPTVEHVPARKTNLSRLNVAKESENEPSLQIEWAVDKGISWLFSESPLRQEKLGSFPYCFSLSPNSTSSWPMINEQDLRIRSTISMECEDAEDAFWDHIRGKKIEVPVTNENFGFVANGGTINLVLILPKANGVFSDSIETLKSTKPEADILKTAKELGQPVISVVLEPHRTNGGRKDLSSQGDLTPKSSTQSTLAEAVAAFNKQSADDRRTLFNPPIPDMTEDQLRQGFADAAKEHRDAGESHIADTLLKISETGVISTDDSIGVLLAGGIANIFQKDGTRHKDGKPETKQIVPALVLSDGSGGLKYVVLRPLELIYNRNGHSSQAYGDLYKNNEHSPKKTVTIQIPLDASRHPAEMLAKNLFYQGLSLYAEGVTGRFKGSEEAVSSTIVIAHDCKLSSFEAIERDGKEFWLATFAVPFQNEILHLRPGMTREEVEADFDVKVIQNRLDGMSKDGARFLLDHYLGQDSAKTLLRNGQGQPDTENIDSPRAAVPAEETPQEMPVDGSAGADDQKGDELNQGADGSLQVDVASADSEVAEVAASANPDAARFPGEWRLDHTFYHTTFPANAPCVISPASIVIGSSQESGAPQKYSYTLRDEQEIDLRLSSEDGLSAPLLGRYQFQENRLFIAFNKDPDAQERPPNATMEDPGKDVALMILEFVGSLDADKAADSGQ